MILASATEAAAPFHGQRCPPNVTARLASDRSIVIEWIQRHSAGVIVSPAFTYIVS